MQKIKQLPLHEAQKIAAGEVVERPANVIKELIENAIDAEATTIALYLESAGHLLMRVVDNGCGMHKQDAIDCFNNHATSKISSINDLNTINTFGFRGEALASIAAISKVTLITKEANAQQGIRISRTDGVIQNTDSVTCNRGTDITIADLFYNVPARKKFLKKQQTELRAIIQLFKAFCLDHLTINFKLYSDNKLIHNCPAVDTVLKRIAQLWDQTIAQQCIKLEKKADDKVTISGVISNHHYVRYNRDQIFFFVNKRWVKNYQLSRALLKGYLNVIPPARYPAACIFIEVDPSQVDINIHPRKEEVQFLHPRAVEGLLQNMVKSHLEQQLSKQLQTSVTFGPPLPQREISPASSVLPSHAFPMPQQMEYQSAVAKPQPIDNQPSYQQVVSSRTYEFRGVLKKTYILLEHTDGLFVIDQHAAHERVLYERFSTNFKQLDTINLLFPEIIELTQQDLALVLKYTELFRANAIGIEQFGQQQLIVNSAPVHLKHISFKELVYEIISLLHEYAEDSITKAMHEKVHAQMACKAAVKAGDSLTEQQITTLLDDLEATENRFSCPHGRPTGWLLSLDEIEKKFKRTL